jgi:putative transposase
MQRALGTSERKACETVGQARSTQRYQPQKRSGEEALVKRMRELSGKHPRYGYRRVWSLLEREGFRVNLKRVHRLWREHGLKVPQRRRKKRATGQARVTRLVLAFSKFRYKAGARPDSPVGLVICLGRRYTWQL